MEFLSELPKYIGIAFFVIFFFGFCVFIHEMGHLLVALWRGLHVETFSIGFGKELWGKTYKGVRYKISMLPFGGYVELPQLETTDQHKDKNGNNLPRTKPLDRILTALAGPLFNVLFGFFLGTIIWLVGVEKPVPANQLTVAYVQPESPDAKAGLKIGDVITKVNGTSFTKGFSEVFERIVLSASKEVVLEVTRQDKTETISYIPAISEDPRFEGLTVPHFMIQSETVISGVVKGSVAEKIGLLKDDEILSLNGQVLLSSQAFIKGISEGEGKPVTLTIKRDGVKKVFTNISPQKQQLHKLGIEVKFIDDYIEVLSLEKETVATGLKVGDHITKLNGKPVDPSSFINAVRYGKGVKIDFDVLRQDENVKISALVPMVDGSAKGTVFKIGAMLAAKTEMVMTHPTPYAQMVNVLVKTKNTLKALFAPQSKVGIKHMSGPVGIVRALSITVSHGFMHGLELVLFITFSLAIMNLLPLPVLDGGHITFAIIESIFGRPLPIKFIRILETAFAIMLISFMLYVTFNDVHRLVRNDSVETVIKI
ncbi:MAG: RIP metalloprotease RseP [Lentisphaeria bacterium]|nr:RIP metalloprotease RseP [Lentisphaeria bacterium]